MTKSVEISDLVTLDEDQQIITNGEAAIIQKLDAMQELLEELVEKVNNINFSDNSGLSIENY